MTYNYLVSKLKQVDFDYRDNIRYKVIFDELILHVEEIMKAKPIRKIIYFDKETIRNILQERNKGNKQTQTEVLVSAQSSAEVEMETSVKLSMPFLQRISFLFSGKIGAKFLIKRDSETTITSTEISEFDALIPNLKKIENVQLKDIENSSTSFRVAGNYLRIMKGQMEEVDVKAFNDVMNDFDGYDVYKADNSLYVRFNNTAFVSNYKRNDLLSTQMTLYAIKVGSFSIDDFDFFEHIKKMEKMFNGFSEGKTLADYDSIEVNTELENPHVPSEHKNNHDIELFDVVYACIVDEKKVLQ